MFWKLPSGACSDSAHHRAPSRPGPEPPAARRRRHTRGTPAAAVWTGQRRQPASPPLPCEAAGHTIVCAGKTLPCGGSVCLGTNYDTRDICIPCGGEQTINTTKLCRTPSLVLSTLAETNGEKIRCLNLSRGELLCSQ